jgi:hypothetical protein
LEVGDPVLSSWDTAVTNCAGANGQMIEAVIAILGLFSAGLFVVHAVDAYRAQ